MIVGTAGHIDHGKTALVKALTGVDADRLPEEKKRGITIDLGFAYRPLPSGEVLGFVDVPGHERFVHNMLAGAIGIDYVLLIVAADDGPKPQTLEHLQIVDLLGLSRGLVAITKTDLVDVAQLAKVEAQVRALLAPTSLAGADIVPVSAITGDGVPEIERRLIDAAAETARQPKGRFRLAVDRVFTLAGAGTVVTGTVFSGSVAVEDRVLLSPSKLEARVRSLHVQNQPAQRGTVGQRCAVNLAGAAIAKDKVKRGEWLLDPALHAPTERIDAELRLLPGEIRSLKHWTPVHLHLGAAHAMARIALTADEPVKPGATALVQLVLDQPLGALHGDRFIVRDQSAQRTIGGGRVLDPFPPPRGRRRPERLAALDALRHDEPAAALAALVGVDPGWVDLDRFGLAWGLTPEELTKAAADSKAKLAVDGETRLGFSAKRWGEFATAATGGLAAHHKAQPESPGLDIERLRALLPGKPPKPVAQVVAASLLRERAIELEGTWHRLPGHSVRLGPQEERLWGRIAPLLRAGKFDPPRTRDYAKATGAREDEIRKLLKRLARMGRLVELGADRFFELPKAAELLRHAQAAEKAAPDNWFTAAHLRDRIGTGRKVAIEILEQLDRLGVTIRRGDARRVAPQKAAIFGK
jgi:selenocysteine-specific elongation factor